MSKRMQKKHSNIQMREENEKLRQQNEELQRQVAELTRQLAEAKATSPNFRKPKKLDEAAVEKIKEYHADGLSNRKISEEFGVTEGTIRNYLKK